jgi:hypothetical protein
MIPQPRKSPSPIYLFTEHGEITAEKAEKIVSKKHNLKGVPFVITGIDVTAGTYECTLDEFLSVAKPVEPKAAPVAESADKQ